MAEGEGRAGERLRVEARPIAGSLLRRAGSFLGTLVVELFELASPFGRPRMDVVVIDVATGRTLKTWREREENAPALVAVLNEELAEMAYDEFAQKWDLPSGS